MTRTLIVLLAAVVMFGCGGNAPQNPVGPSVAPPGSGFTLSGVVTVPGATGSDPCDGAVISVTGGAVRTVHSGAGGRYVITGLPAATYTVTVAWNAHETAQRTVNLTQDTVLNVELKPLR
jgi:hypothetical protein